MSTQILVGDCMERLAALPDESVHCCVTSPPYWMDRDYGHDGQIGQEETLAEYVDGLVKAFGAMRHALTNDATLFINEGDCHNGTGGAGGDYCPGGGRHGQIKYGGRNDPTLKPKDLCAAPYRLGLALQADGWYWRQVIVWKKPNGGNRESVMDRPRTDYEPVLLLSKSRIYYYNQTEEAKKAVWEIPVSTGGTGHFAMMPEELARRCIEAGCPEGGTVLDPFFGAGTTGLVADRLGRNCVGIELNQDYAEIARKRIRDDNPMFASVTVL